MWLRHRHFFRGHPKRVLIGSPQKKQGSALAAYAGLGNLAPGMFAALLPSMVAFMGFKFSYSLCFAFVLLIFVLVLIFMKDASYFQYRQMGIEIDPDALLHACGEELLPSGGAADSLKKAGANWRTWVLTFFYFINFGGFVIPPLMGLFVNISPVKGYSNGFLVFTILTLIALVFLYVLYRFPPQEPAQ